MEEADKELVKKEIGVPEPRFLYKNIFTFKEKHNIGFISKLSAQKRKLEIKKEDENEVDESSEAKKSKNEQLEKELKLKVIIWNLELTILKTGINCLKLHRLNLKSSGSCEML